MDHAQCSLILSHTMFLDTITHNVPWYYHIQCSLILSHTMFLDTITHNVPWYYHTQCSLILSHTMFLDTRTFQSLWDVNVIWLLKKMNISKNLAAIENLDHTYKREGNLDHFCIPQNQLFFVGMFFCKRVFIFNNSLLHSSPSPSNYWKLVFQELKWDHSIFNVFVQYQFKTIHLIILCSLNHNIQL